MRKISIKRQKQLDEYYILREKFLQDNPYCEICGTIADTVHHRIGRGKYLNDEKYFCSLCNEHHNYIHMNPEWSYLNGYMIKRNTK